MSEQCLNIILGSLETPDFKLFIMLPLHIILKMNHQATSQNFAKYLSVCVGK